MPDIGLLEMLLIGIIGFLVLGPERLPEFFSQISRALRSVRSWISNIKQQVETETYALKQPADEVKDALSGGLSSVTEEIEKSKNDSSVNQPS